MTITSHRKPDTGAHTDRVTAPGRRKGTILALLAAALIGATIGAGTVYGVTNDPPAACEQALQAAEHLDGLWDTLTQTAADAVTAASKNDAATLHRLTADLKNPGGINDQIAAGRAAFDDYAAACRS